MLDDLFDRNLAWSLTKTKADPEYFRRLAALQAPRYLWIGCSDSRVPANEVVGLEPGELFVHRNIANVVHTSDLNLLSVLEFAIENLAVEDIIVCGHYGCGGVRRALTGGKGGLVDHWLAPVTELHARHRDRLDAIRDEEARVNALCELNVELQVRRVAATPIIAAAWGRGRRVAVHGWVYGLKDGLLRDLGVTIASLADREANDARRRAGRPVLKAKGGPRTAADTAMGVLAASSACTCGTAPDETRNPENPSC